MAVNAGYTMLPNEVIESEITYQAKSVFTLLSKYASADSPFVWPSRKALADGMGMTRAKAVDRYLTELEDAGFIRREYRPNQSTRYELVRWENGVAFTRFRTPSQVQGTRGSQAQVTGWSGTGAQVVRHRGHELDPLTKPTNQTQSLTICETTDLGKCDLDSLDATRRGGHPPDEQTRAAIWEKQDDGESSTPVDAEEKTRDAGDRAGQKIQDSIDAEPSIEHVVEEPIVLELPVPLNVDIESLIATAPADMNEHEEAALRAAKFGWDPYGKTWVDMSMFG